MDAPIEFRFAVKQRLAAVLGEPQVLTVAPGEIYRWSLPRMYGLTLYVSLDAPEHGDVAYLTVSDGPKFQAKPVESHLLKTHAEVEAMVERIVRQWRGSGARALGLDGVT